MFPEVQSVVKIVSLVKGGRLPFLNNGIFGQNAYNFLFKLFPLDCSHLLLLLTRSSVILFPPVRSVAVVRQQAPPPVAAEAAVALARLRVAGAHQRAGDVLDLVLYNLTDP